MNVRFALVLAAAPCAALGCSLLVPIDAAGGEDDPDAQVAALDATAEATSPADAGVEASANAGSACPPDAVLCDSFERASVLTADWSGVFGTPSTSTDRAVSGTRSLLASLRANGTGSGVERQVQRGSKRVAVRAKIFMPTAPVGTIEIAKAPFGEANRWDSFTLAVAPEGLRVSAQRYDGSPAPAAIVGQQLLDATQAFGRWLALDVVIDVTKTPKTMSVAIDGGKPYVLGLDSTNVQSGIASFFFGCTWYSEPPKDFDLFIDDVVIAPAP